MRNNQSGIEFNTKGLLGIIALGLTAVLILFGGWAFYKNVQVWSAQKSGEAELAQASQNRQIAVNEAQAKAESAVLLARAEIERARGVAEANRIIGESLKGNEAYLRYLWISSLDNGAEPTIIYIPTEAGMPILESRRIEGK